MQALFSTTELILSTSVISWLLMAGLLFVLICSALILLLRGNQFAPTRSENSIWLFLAVLFTSGLDLGLIFLPKIDFQQADLTGFSFHSPLATEFGFWAGLIWLIYFASCYYFAEIEPKVGFFKIKVVSWLNNLVIILTCAFSGHLLLTSLPEHLQLFDLAQLQTQQLAYLLTGLVLLLAVLSSSKLSNIARLSWFSCLIFFTLIAVCANQSDLSLNKLTEHSAEMALYWLNIDEFIFSANQYYQFYLFWWFAWSIMIGQFNARFLPKLRWYQIALFTLIVPAVPIGLWLIVSYHQLLNQVSYPFVVSLFMLLTALLFAMNSLDSLIRLYSDNFGFTRKKIGLSRYIAVHLLSLLGLTLLFNSQLIKIEILGMTVIFLQWFAAAYALYYFTKRSQAFANLLLTFKLKA